MSVETAQAQEMIQIVSVLQTPDKKVEIIYTLTPADPAPSNGYDLTVLAMETSQDCAATSTTPDSALDDITSYITGSLNVTSGSGLLTWDVRNMPAGALKTKYWKANVNVLFRLKATPNNPAISIEMVSVPAGSFIMGNSQRGDDATYGASDESPTHTVTLSAYQIGKYHVTNGQYCAVMNWALGKGYVKGDASGAPYSSGDAYAAGQKMIAITDSNCPVQYLGASSGGFSWKSQIGAGGVTYSLESHPVTDVTWYGAVVFCNWLSEKDGFTACYDLTSWTLIQGNNGYRLPTEAEWERAAAWDGSKHWIYSFMSDTLTGKNRCNYYDYNPSCVNPLGLQSFPNTSPVGWFNGVNISPNGNIQTVNSPSPVGCYDMSGNIWQWCYDLYGAYSSGAQTDPLGATSGTNRVECGGYWYNPNYHCRSAARSHPDPDYSNRGIGFRIACGTFAF
ncbi:MAG: SUMF1/EgtB/PvdO family nonheme iron enzyme [Candidatus Sumerlaeota bacterium]|nr:SUMF1/EgtB/PvdO family nonheme iron enzyme [Candidatus Sumerlaeota bacterium]